MAKNQFSDEIRCTAKSKSTGERCKRPRHPGTNVCRTHGGLGAVRSIKHGKRSKNKSVLHRLPLFSEEVDAYLKDTEGLKDVGREIAIFRVLVDKRLQGAKRRKAQDEEGSIECFVQERIAEAERISALGKAITKGASISDEDRIWFEAQRLAEALTPYEEGRIADFCTRAGDLIAKKSKMEDGVKHTVSIAEMSTLISQLQTAVRDAVRDVVGEEKAEEVSEALGKKIATIRRGRVVA